MRISITKGLPKDSQTDLEISRLRAGSVSFGKPFFRSTSKNGELWKKKRSGIATHAAVKFQRLRKNQNQVLIILSIPVLSAENIQGLERSRKTATKDRKTNTPQKISGCLIARYVSGQKPVQDLVESLKSITSQKSKTEEKTPPLTLWRHVLLATALFTTSENI